MQLEAKETKRDKNLVDAHVVIPKDEVDKSINHAYKDISHKYSFQGFRKGHVPPPVINAQLGQDTVMTFATSNLLEQADPSIMSTLDLVPIDKIDCDEVGTVKRGEDFAFDIKIPVAPEAELTSYDAVSITMPPEEVTDAELENQLEMLASYSAKPKDLPKSKGASKDDFVEAEFTNISNADDFSGKRTIVLNNESYPEELRKALTGVKKGDVKKISFAEKNAKGEPIQREVEAKIERVYTFETPELTDDMAKTLGFDSLDALKKNLKDEIKKDKKKQLPELKQRRVLQALCDRVKDREVLEKEDAYKTYQKFVLRTVSQNFMNSLAMQGQTVDSFLAAQNISASTLMADLEHQAEHYARESLALDALARHNKIEATDEDVYDEFSAAGAKDAEHEISHAFDDGRLPDIKESIRRHKALTWLVDNAKVTVKDEVAERRKKDDVKNKS